MSKKTSVLFVCMGNICRSPTGECVFRQQVNEAGLDHLFEIDSAGTIGYHAGESPDSRMREAARSRGVRLEGSARQFRPADFEKFDVIIAMDRNNLRDILAQDPAGKYKDKVHLMLDFHPDAGTKDVPDPYYGGREGFERVLDLVEVACEALLTHLTED